MIYILTYVQNYNNNDFFIKVALNKKIDKI